jgi:hypothetical protein
MRQTQVATHQTIAGLLRKAQAQGEITRDIDVDRETVALFALVDGLVSHVLLDHYTGDEALRAIDDQLNRLFHP